MNGRLKVIETIFTTSQLEDQYSELNASHYSRSGNTQKAMDYLQPCGTAGGRSAPPMWKRLLTSAKGWSCSNPAGYPRAHPARTPLQIALGAP